MKKSVITKVITYDIDDDGKANGGDDLIAGESSYEEEEEEAAEQTGPRAKQDPVPDSLKRVFANKKPIKVIESDDEEEGTKQPSLFTKVNNLKSLDLAADSATVQE